MNNRILGVIQEAFRNGSCLNVNFTNERTVELINDFVETICVKHPLKTNQWWVLSELIDDLLERKYSNKRIANFLKKQVEECKELMIR